MGVGNRACVHIDVSVEGEGEAQKVTVKPENDKENQVKRCDVSTYPLEFEEKR